MDSRIDQVPDIPVNGHHHVFLGASSAHNEKRTWIVVAMTAVMTIIEIIGGAVFHSIALVADGIHMSTHAGVMLLAALAYRYARRHAEDERFALGTGKLGDLAAFTSAIVLAMFALLIGYEAISRFMAPENIDYGAALGIAALGLLVNAASALALADSHHHDDGHHHRHDHDHHHDSHDFGRLIETASGPVRLGVFEDGVPPRFRLHGLAASQPVLIETIRPDGAQQVFAMRAQAGYLESVDSIPEPHEFRAILTFGDESHDLAFEEHEHDEHLHRDNNMRAAYVHVLADSAVSVLVIIGLLMAKFLGWVWMDPVMGIVGALVVANWSFGLIRASGAVLLDMAPGPEIRGRIKSMLEQDGGRVTDLHVWRLGPGHLGAIIALRTATPLPPESYRRRLAAITGLSHVTIEVDAVSR